MKLPKFGVKQARGLKVGECVLVTKARCKNPNSAIKATASKEGISVTCETVYLVIPSMNLTLNVSLVTRVT